MNLYQVETQYRLKIDALLRDAEENSLPAEVVNDTLEALQGELEVKQVNIAAYILDLEAQEAAMDNYITNMQIRKRLINDRKNRLKRYVIDSMKRTGRKKLESDEFSVSLRQSQRVHITDVTYLPEEYVRQTISVEPDKARIKEALKMGKRIEGALLEEHDNLIIK